MKKILSLLLAVAMMCSLVVVGAETPAGETAIQIKAVADNTSYAKEDNVKVTLAVKTGTLGLANLQLTYAVPTGLTFTSATALNEDVFPHAMDTNDDGSLKVTDTLTWDKSADSKKVGMKAENFLNILEMNFTVNNDATVGDDITFTFTSGEESALEFKDGEYVTINSSSVSLAVVNKFAIKSVADVTATANVGDTVDTIKAELAKKTATVYSNADKTGSEGSVATTNWNLTSANYTGAVGTYEFTGEVVPTTNFSLDAGVTSMPVKGNVTIAAADLATADAPTDIEATVVVVENGGEKDVADLTFKNALPTTVKVKKGIYEETVNVGTWGPATEGAKLNIGTKGATIAVKAQTTPDADSSFTGTGEVTATVKVIAAEITGSKVTLGSKNPKNKPEATVTITKAAFDELTADTTTGEGDDAVVTGNNEVELTITAGDVTKTVKVSGIKTSDFTENADGTYSFKLTKNAAGNDKTWAELGFADGTAVKVTAAVNGSILVAEEGDNGEVDATIKKPMSGSGTSGIGVPVGGGTIGGTTTPTEPTDPTEPTEPTEPTDPTEPTEPVAGPFSDVPADFWAVEAITTLKDANIIGGVTATEFAPDADITRAEFTKMVVGLMGLEAASTDVAFTDCGADDWFTPYVAAAVEAGLVTGMTETEFAPNATITREQAMTIVGRAIAKDATAGELAFTDADKISDYAAPYVAILTQMGVVGGYSDGTIRPDANITRAEAAKIIAGLYAEMQNNAEVEADADADVEAEVETDADIAEGEIEDVTDETVDTIDEEPEK